MRTGSRIDDSEEFKEFEEFRAELLGEPKQAKKYETGPAFFGGRRERFAGATDDDEAKRERLAAFEARMECEAADRERAKQAAKAARVASVQEKRQAARTRMERALAEKNAQERAQRAVDLQSVADEQARLDASDPFACFAKAQRKKPRKRKPTRQLEVDPHQMFYGDHRTVFKTQSEAIDSEDVAKRERLRAFESQLAEKEQAEASEGREQVRRHAAEQQKRRRRALERMERGRARDRAAKRQAQEEEQAREANLRAAQLAKEEGRRAALRRKQAQEQAVLDASDPVVKFRKERAQRKKTGEPTAGAGG